MSYFLQPGTGKTSTLVELILQAILKQQRILVTAPSNIAVDTILIRLTMALEDAIAHTSTRKAGTSSDTLDDNNSTKNGMSELEILTNAKRNLVRLGHPARIHAITQQYSLDCRISMDEVSSSCLILHYARTVIDGLHVLKLCLKNRLLFSLDINSI